MKLDWEIIKSLLEKCEADSLGSFIKNEVGKVPDKYLTLPFDERQKLEEEAKRQSDIIFGHLMLCLGGT